MKGILVSVDYTDLLSITLPYNRYHFSEVWVVTSSANVDELESLVVQNSSQLVVTDLFYASGAVFNKWAALEYGLDVMGRYSDSDPWICLMDADVLWPRVLSVCSKQVNMTMGCKRCIGSETLQCGAFEETLVKGCLYTPLRRMYTSLSQPIPHESMWFNYPIHPNIYEWAGYSQIFHCDDPALGKPPWHEVDWVHAGGADSMFQRKWDTSHKIRPPFDVLHLGQAGINWCGRSTPYLDGTVPSESEDRSRMVRGYIKKRGYHAARGDRFRGEKLR